MGRAVKSNLPQTAGNYRTYSSAIFLASLTSCKPCWQNTLGQVIHVVVVVVVVAGGRPTGLPRIRRWMSLVDMVLTLRLCCDQLIAELTGISS